MLSILVYFVLPFLLLLEGMRADIQVSKPVQENA